MTDVVVSSEASPKVPAPKEETSRGWLVAEALLAVAVIAACFFYAIPKFRATRRS